MRIVRYVAADCTVGYGDLAGELVHPLAGPVGDMRRAATPPVLVAELRLLAPVVPSKIVAIGPGYRQSMGDLPLPDQPLLWIKPATTVNDPDGVIRVPPQAPEIYHEAELAIVIGRTARAVDEAEADRYIWGYTCMNDVTAGPLSDPRAFMATHYYVDGKIFDGFAPLGPCIVTDLDPSDLHMECRINGERRQSHSSADRMWTSAWLVSTISRIVTLLPGDVISTGSIPNPQRMRAGDVVEVEIDGIGVLRNTVC